METDHIQHRLLSMADPIYQTFQCRLMPGIVPERVLGVRMPALRKLSRELRDKPEAELFLQRLPHRYYDEDNLHGLLISAGSDYSRVVSQLETFLPHVDNWATCDLIRPKVFSRHKDLLLPQIRQWLQSYHVFTVRFGLEMLMVHYLHQPVISEYLQMAAAIHREEYYIRMMVAWFFATALTCRYQETLPVLEDRILPQWIHNKTIQKATESLQISTERKEYLKTLRIKTISSTGSTNP